MKKLFIYIFSLFLIFGFSSCNDQEVKQINLKNNNIEENISKDEIQKGEKNELEKFNKDIKKISFTELNNSLYSRWGWDNLVEKIKVLSWTWETLENKLKSTFLESFIWDYKNALENRKKLCKNINSDFCKKNKLKLISYRPVDFKWNILDNLKIIIDWRDFWKLKWKNNFVLENKFIHRIKLSKEWYLDFYKKVFIDSNWDLNESINPKLLKSDLEKGINNNEKIKIKSDNFIFNINKNSFITENWNEYKWKVKVYIFDITEEDWDLNILNLDVFDDKWTYLWNSMVTFWMPLIKAYDEEWNELKIWKEVLWKWKIQNQEKSPNMDLVNVPKNKWLSKNDLDKYNIPPFWYLDQNNGVWVNSKMKILDNEWNYEFKLFTK